MATGWNKQLETGNAIIDNQHKELFEAFDRFLEACSSGKGKDEVDRTLDFLVNYTVRHFADEEKLQVQFNYSGYEQHKKMHDNFKAVVQELSDQLKKEGPTAILTTKATMVIGDWLRNHIRVEDQKIANHIKR